MLAQMKGASINTTWNSSAFGDTTSLNNAGNYEVNTICYIHLDTAFLVYSILNNYTNNAMVQLVKIPQYQNAVVIDSLKATPWNSTLGTGGILAIIVEEDLILNAPVSADAAGYRGGSYAVSSGDCSNTFDANGYAYTGSFLGPQSGAYKGESVVVLANNNTGGRGAAASGGGGGNNHNNSGAGGSNLSRGGRGGGNHSGIGCNESFPGEGGKALSNLNGFKIFAGGGGGAGHSNNGTATTRGGGHGGGICFIQAKDLTTNGYTISANGQIGGGSIGDGASGGGGGGTIILQVINFADAVSIHANGGNGGLSNDGGTPQRCYGGGGGGGGGAVYLSGTSPAGSITVEGGTGGQETGSYGVCATAVPGLDGNTGLTFFNYPYRSSIRLASYCASILAEKVNDFKAIYSDGTTTLRWMVGDAGLIQQFVIERSANGVQWTKIGYSAADHNQNVYETKDWAPESGYNYYRIIIIYHNLQSAYSSVERIFVQREKTSWQIYPNPANDFIYVQNGGNQTTGVLQLMDLSGKIICQYSVIFNQPRIKLSLPSLAKGVYLVKMNTVVERLVIR